MNVLLVEPQYKNKYPPMGLMKISTYHKSRGDRVIFYKGVLPKSEFEKHKFDRVYITSLFTFYYSITVKTIKSYIKLIPASNIYVGGIMVSLMPERLRKDIDNSVHILTGLLTDTDCLGFDDHVNVDILPLDYSILDHIAYEYPAGENYFAYTSRGCTNKCKFCAVPKLEPEFCLTNNIVSQISATKKAYGERQNLLLLDNNILSFGVNELAEIVEDIRSLGFDGKTKFYAELPFKTFLRKLSKVNQEDPAFKNILNKLVNYLDKQSKRKMSKNYSEKYHEILNQIINADDKYTIIQKNQDTLLEILGFYYKPVGRKRYVDFNQGIDARQLTQEKMEVLARVPIKPFRLAYDNIKYTSIYKKAMTIAVNNGVDNFSNYILYNYDDTPCDLWDRLEVNIKLAKQLNVKIFSFPMKYAPIDRIDRKYIGIHWNKHFLSNIQAILNVTKGIVASGEDFFYKAFGQSHEEFYELLYMPRDYVMYRSTYENNGLAQQWREKFADLSYEQKEELIAALCNNIKPQTESVSNLLLFYSQMNKEEI